MDPDNVGRRCRQHQEIRCTAEVCVADALDFATNPNRPRPVATVGAPEVSRGMSGYVRKEPPPREPVVAEVPVQRRSAAPTADEIREAFGSVPTEIAHLSRGFNSSPDRRNRQ